MLEGGPTGFRDKVGAVRGICSELGMEGDLIGSTPSGSRWIRRGGRLRSFPASLLGFLESDLLSLRGRLRMLMEPLVPSRSEDETVEEFAVRRLGAEAARYLVDPIITGVFAGDPCKLSLQACLPHLAALESRGRSLLLALLRSRGRSRPLTSFREGTDQVVRILARSLGRRLVLDAPVLGIGRRPGGFRVRVGGSMLGTVECSAVVSAAPAPAARRYLSELDEELA